MASEDDKDGSSGDDEELGLDEDDPGALQQVLKMEDVRILHDTRFSVEMRAKFDSNARKAHSINGLWIEIRQALKNETGNVYSVNALKVKLIISRLFHYICVRAVIVHVCVCVMYDAIS